MRTHVFYTTGTALFVTRFVRNGNISGSIVSLGEIVLIKYVLTLESLLALPNFRDIGPNIQLVVRIEERFMVVADNQSQELSSGEVVVKRSTIDCSLGLVCTLVKRAFAQNGFSSSAIDVTGLIKYNTLTEIKLTSMVLKSGCVANE